MKVGLLIAASLLAPRLSTPGVVHQQPLSVSLTAYGWQRHSDLQETYEYVEMPQVAFGDGDTVYVGYSRTSRSLLKRQDTPDKSFRVLSISAESGKVLRSLDFPTDSLWKVGLVSAADDSLIVVTDKTIRKLNADGSVKERLDITLYLFGMMPSASGLTLDFWGGQASFFVRSSDLGVIARCVQTTHPPAFNDTSQVVDDSIQNKSTIVKARLCGEFKPAYRLAPYLSQLSLLSDSSLIGFDHDFMYFWRNGNLVWSNHIRRHYIFESIVPSRNEQRVAILWTEQHGGSNILDTDPKITAQHIAVYDIRDGKELLVIHLPATGCDGFAISNTGDRVAVYHDGALDLWKV
jgi:hypothetical protein